MKQCRFLCLLVILISEYRAENPTIPALPEFNGDSSICTGSSTPPSGSDRPQPTFPRKAEFAAELIAMGHLLNQTIPTMLTSLHYIYDYDANILILHKNMEGLNDIEYFYYSILKKSVYLRGEVCGVLDIDKNKINDGTSAFLMPNGTWHIRPLNEFLLFSSDGTGGPVIQPKYIGQTTVRGIPVDQWETCIVDKPNYATYRRLWSFAQQGFRPPSGIVTNFAFPVQAVINASVLFPNGSRYQDADEVFNIYSYRPGIIESADQLAPPRGTFCSSGQGQNLVSLDDERVGWPNTFSVRVDALSSLSSRWQRFHLRYERDPDSDRTRRIRYDYMPPGGEDFRSVIHDYTADLTYAIDRRTGSCEITRGVHTDVVSPIIDPITFFVKHERRFIADTRQRIWALNGLRPCRGNTIECVSLTAGIDNFPDIVDPDTGKPSGESWDGTSMDYGWSRRSMTARPSDTDKVFDYPVYLFLRFYRKTDRPGLLGIRTEDVEYEFYEMSHQLNPSDFDISTCYRTRNFEYLHVSMDLQSSTANAIDGNLLDKNTLEIQIHKNLVDKMQIAYGRVADIEIFHENAGNNVNVFFTLLGPTPRPESPSGISDETTADASRNTLKRAVDSGAFQFTVKAINDPSTEIEFKAVTGSLKDSRTFMSSHSVGKPLVKESYSGGAIAGGIIGGLLVGLIVGIIIAAIARVVRKEPLPQVPFLSNSFTNPLPSINFYNKKTNNDTKPSTDAKDQSAA